MSQLCKVPSFLPKIVWVLLRGLWNTNCSWVAWTEPNASADHTKYLFGLHKSHLRALRNHEIKGDTAVVHQIAPKCLQNQLKPPETLSKFNNLKSKQQNVVYQDTYGDQTTNPATYSSEKPPKSPTALGFSWNPPITTWDHACSLNLFLELATISPIHWRVNLLSEKRKFL